MRLGLLVLAAAGLAAQASPSSAQAAPPVSGAQSGYVLPETEMWDLTSTGGEPYRIMVSHPDGPEPPNGYPVLYVLDGNAFFAGFANSRRLQEISDHDLSNSMIVAVGYPTDKPYDFERRMKDFTPPFRNPIPASEKPFEHWSVGGNDRFMSFLIDELRPAVARRYPIDPNRQALFGHSLGGLFALHVLYHRPEAFLAIIAASPSIYWNDQSILDEEREFVTRLAKSRFRTPRLLLVCGEREETRDEQWDATALAQRLTPLSAYGLRSQFELYKDEPHLGVPTRAITSTLRFAFAWP
jgi:predicted alpha/beta superfamily hydrolase